MAGVAGKVAEIAGNVALAEGVELDKIDRIYSVSPLTESVSQSQSVAVAAIVLDREIMKLLETETETNTKKEGGVQSGSDSA